MSEAAVKEFDAAIKSLGDKLAELTLKQAVELGDYMKEAYGIEAAAGGVVMAAGPAAAAAEEGALQRPHLEAGRGAAVDLADPAGDDRGGQARGAGVLSGAQSASTSVSRRRSNRIVPARTRAAQ